MKTQKTITIKGHKYTAPELMNLDFYPTNGDERIVEIQGGEVAFSVREDYIVVRQHGAVRRNNRGYGDAVAILAR